MNNLTIVNLNGVNVTDSREVAEMTGKKHAHLLRDIQGYIKVISTNPKLDSLNFFIESTYKDGKGEIRPCYLLTKQGCEMVANKMTGEKGILFTAEYVQAFNKMEQHIKEPKKLSAMEQLKLQYEVLDEHDKEIKEVKGEVQNLKDNMPLFNVECKELQAAVRRLGIKLMGGKDTNAYKDNSLRGKIYSDIQTEVKRQFQVTRYEAIKRSQLSTAYKILENYKLPMALKDEILKTNNQVSFEEAM